MRPGAVSFYPLPFFKAYIRGVHLSRDVLVFVIFMFDTLFSSVFNTRVCRFFRPSLIIVLCFSHLWSMSFIYENSRSCTEEFSVLYTKFDIKIEIQSVKSKMSCSRIPFMYSKHS